MDNHYLYKWNCPKWKYQFFICSFYLIQALYLIHVPTFLLIHSLIDMQENCMLWLKDRLMVFFFIIMFREMGVRIELWMMNFEYSFLVISFKTRLILHAIL
ncbi:hypothetical protein POPTR_019G032401v4 [Populus trichocarpa]|uniref:Uncharacterized protein n=1 Tax=Populus trichocarpa TaxID=3694 RepID=A0ACC0RJE3_POPTR|nr:hypothetical protein POPTR_019G032401v4 [Populus trichocarpa]